LAYTPRSLN